MRFLTIKEIQELSDIELAMQARAAIYATLEGSRHGAEVVQYLGNLAKEAHLRYNNRVSVGASKLKDRGE